MHFILLVACIPVVVSIGSETPGARDGYKLSPVRGRREISKFLLGKWCPWEPWSPCNTTDGTEMAALGVASGVCMIKGVRVRVRKCECPKPVVEVFSRIVGRCSSLREESRENCEAECPADIPESAAIPSFYVFLIIAVSCVAVAGFFTCLYSSLRMCRRRHRHHRGGEGPWCFADTDSGLPANALEINSIETDAEAMMMAQAVTDRPPGYEEVMAEERDKEPPPPLYNALFPDEAAAAEACENYEPAEAGRGAAKVGEET